MVAFQALQITSRIIRTYNIQYTKCHLILYSFNPQNK